MSSGSAVEFAERILTSHVKHAAVASTYLLTGAAGAEKTERALSFARALNCREKKFRDCSCISCHKVTGRTHPDVHWFGEDVKAKSIKIEEIREVKNQAALKPYEGKWKVFIFADAEKLTVEAQNALLKSLEEPPAHTVFVLLADNKENLLETLRSRAFEVRCRPAGEFRDENEVASLLPDAGRKRWEDLLEEYYGSPREEVQEMLSSLLHYLNQTLRQAAANEDNPRIAALLHAMDRVFETQEAIDDNVNPKIAMTRLAVKLRKAAPVHAGGES